MIAQSVGCSHSQLRKRVEPLSAGVHSRRGRVPARVAAQREVEIYGSAAARKAAFDEAEPSSSACVSTRRVRAAPLPHANLSVSVGDPAGPERRYPGTGIPGSLVRPSASAASSNSISGRRPARKAW
jgi:hypothetical protein